MSVIEEKKKKHLYTASKNTKLFVNQPPKELFKVVVNNYSQKEKFPEKQKQETGKTIMGHHQSLPPQPSGYIKYPKYDWF